MHNSEMDKSFVTADVDQLVKDLTVVEKISLLAGKNFWDVKVTDGPNGARGGVTPATALPCATALAATFSTPLLHSAGNLLAAEAKARNAVCLLAPTINIQRSPLGGRAFESFSEDPIVSGQIASAYINGLQEKGVSATIKHFVGNDQEHERNGEDSIIASRALREIYLRPFQIAQKHASPQAYMTSYNKVNGTHVSEDSSLLQDILRKEWGHKGLVMSDWYGTYSVSESINNGLDLEMPGPARWRDPVLVNHLINAHKIDPRTIDIRVKYILNWVQKLVKANEELVYSSEKPERTRTEDQKEDAKFLRQLGGEGIVLLKNEGVLPVTGTKTLAVIGPNAKVKVLTGGGSAQLRSAWSSTPLAALEENKPKDVKIDYSVGCTTSKYLPILDDDFTTLDGKPGFNLRHYAVVDGVQSKQPIAEEVWDDSYMFMVDYVPVAFGEPFITEIEAILTAPNTGKYEFGLTITGQAWLYADDKLVVENSKDQVWGTAFFGNGTEEKRGSFNVEKGKKYRIRFVHDSRKSASVTHASQFNMTACRLGGAAVIDEEEAISQAVELAKKSDIAVIVAGLNADWESEGYDRPNLSLPGGSNELISRVSAANPNTIVVLQAGSAVSMPWLDSVKGVVYAWYGGNESSNVIADVIYGVTNPSGRLPLTLPKRELDIPANLNYKSARTKIHYEEGIWVGYKHYNARGIEPLFPFGHGLSYTTFDYSDLSINVTGTTPDEWKLAVKVKVTNSGKIAGAHSVHIYTCPPAETPTSLVHPKQAVQGFTKVRLGAGESQIAEVTLDKYAISHWDEGYKTWRVELGEWSVKIGKDAQTMWGDEKFTIKEEMEWIGL